MNQGKKSINKANKLPPLITWSIIGLCIIPLILTLLGMNFGYQHVDLETPNLEKFFIGSLMKIIFSAMAGPLTHVLLEWSSVCLAIFIMTLAYFHYQLTKDIAILTISTILFFSGILDGFHILTASHLISIHASDLLVPFIGTASRLFNACLMLITVGMFVIAALRKQPIEKSTCFIFLIAVGIFAIGLIFELMLDSKLPITYYPDAHVTRPYNFALLVIYTFSLIFVYPEFYKYKPSPFAHALIFMVSAEILVELNALGSVHPFDHHYNLAHFFKNIAYLVPTLGLMVSYNQAKIKSVKKHGKTAQPTKK